MSKTLSHLVAVLARLVSHRRGAVFIAAGTLLLIVTAVLCWRLKLDTEVTNLLPRGFATVEGLKSYDREFAQARELTLALVNEQNPEALDEFAPRFVEALRKEPWVVRVLDGLPMEGGSDDAGTTKLAVPLLLNLDTATFERAIASLEPDAIAARLHKLRQSVEVGSPSAEMKLQTDPLGLLESLARALTSASSIDSPEPLTSPDGTMRVIIVVTNQTEIGAFACRDLMKDVHAFVERVQASWPNDAPKILITGRSAYVAEMSLLMRRDVVWTVISSVALVSGVFYVGFRRFRPLVGLAAVILLSCLVALALGSLVFPATNMISIGLCAILFGLGVDFGILHFSSYQHSRQQGLNHEQAVGAAIRHLTPGIFFGAVTTAVAFLALALSNTVAFTQLGVLIAIGILCAAFFMSSLFFLFVGSKHKEHRDFVIPLGRTFTSAIYRRPMVWLIAGTLCLGGLTALVFAPVLRLRFDTDLRALEPRHSKAAQTLHLIQSKMPATSDRILVLLEAPDAQTFHDQWARLTRRWQDLREQGLLRSISSPAAFAISPANVQANRDRLARVDLAAARRAFSAALEGEGFSEEAFGGTYELFDALGLSTAPEYRIAPWSELLPESSSWWFLLDQFFSARPNFGAAYLAPGEPVKTAEDKEELLAQLSLVDVPAQFSGWTFTLADLIPWSKWKLLELTGAMVLFNVALLALLFRRALPLAVLIAGLALAVGALLGSLKLFDLPLNIFNVLAFPLVLGVGVDYGIHVFLAARQPRGAQNAVAAMFKPLLLSGLTTIAGFGSLAFANNPALAGLGIVCALGTFWCLFATFLVMMPAYALRYPGQVAPPHPTKCITELAGRE